MKTVNSAILVATFMLGVANSAWADPMGTAFSYQGQLKESGLPVTDLCDFKFTLYDGEASPTQVGPTLTFDGQGANPYPIDVENGLFGVKLDFGADIFTGEKRWLEIEVARPSGGAYVLLDPRQEVTPTPYAIHAGTVGSVSGTANRIAKFTGNDTIGDSAVYQNSEGNIGICGAPYWGGGYGPNLHVNAGAEQATVWIGNNMTGAGEEIGYLSWVGSGGMGPTTYASITTEIVATSPWPRGALLFRTADTLSIPPPPVDMRINPNGDVGIGTDTPQAKLHIGGVAGTDGIMFPDGTVQTTAASGGGGGGWVDDGGVVRLQSSADSVGIGTTSPGAKLDVRGTNETSRASLDSDRWIEMLYSSGSGPLLRGDGYPRLTLDADVGAAGIIALGVGGDKVGIGTITPASQLDVVGTAEMDGFKMPTGAANGRVLTSNASGVGTWQAASSGMGGSGSTNYLPKFTDASTLGDSVIYQNGSTIGIGTTVPGGYAKLHVHTSDEASLKLTNGATGTDYGDGAQLAFWSPSSSNLYLLNRENAHILFGTNNGEKMRLTSDGKLAIGNTAPWCKLDVRDSGQRVVHAENTGPSGQLDAAIYAISGPLTGAGTAGDFTGGYRGVLGSGGVIGVEGIANGDGGTKMGIYGHAAGSGINWAGYFDGNVFVTGTINKSACSFKIDHPLEPADKYLYHSVIESPDMKNVYDGVTALDADGEAWVQLPEWFEALNRDFRYQLTCVGGFAPVYVAEEVSNNRFKVAGGKPGMKVSWQITGIRQDAYANANRLPVEVDKPAEERGKYLTPAAFGLPEEMALHARPKAVAND